MVLVTMGMLVWDIMAMLVLVIMDMLDLVITDTLVLGILTMLTTMESVRPRPSLRLRLTLPFFTAPMAMVLATMAMLVWDIMAMLDLVTMDTLVLGILAMLTTMASVRPRPSLRLTLPFFTAPMAMVLVTMGMLVLDIMAMLVWVTMDMLDLVITDTLVLDILDTLPTMASVQRD